MTGYLTGLSWPNIRFESREYSFEMEKSKILPILLIYKSILLSNMKRND